MQLTLLFTVLMAVQIANCLIVEPGMLIDPYWSFEIEAKCGPGPLQSAYAEKSFQQTGLISIGFGAYCGMVFSWYYFNGQKGLEEPYAKGGCKALLRLFVFSALAIPGGLFYLLNFIGIEN